MTSLKGAPHSALSEGAVPASIARLALPDERIVSYRLFGSPGGVPLFALHGTPGSRLKFSVTDAIARALGLRVIALDRWGYAETSPHPAPSLQAFAADLGIVADLLAIDRFAVMGVSGGGPYAAAAAAVMPGRVTALALVAPVGPIAGEADSEITPFHRLCFGPIANSPATIGAVFGAFRAVLGISPQLGMRLAMIRISSADRSVLRDRDVSARLGATFVEGLRPGVVGPVTDLRLFGAPWDVDLAKARMPSRLWIGTHDYNVPMSAARRLASRLPTCELTPLDGAGHLWIAQNYDVVLSWIAGAAKEARP